MENIPVVKPALVAVSRDCFPVSLSEKRRHAISAAYGDGLYECPITIEKETQVAQVLDDLKAHDCNALILFLGNFGPETSETLLVQKFDGPVMIAAAAEGDGNLYDGRGDAYCGMLNCSYNLGLRSLDHVYIPSYPVGGAEDVAGMIKEFLPVARAYIGVKHLKVISFGPRPQDFLACNAPIQPLYDLGVEIEENSELDLLVAYNKHKDDPRIPEVQKDMERELGPKNPYSGVIPRLAQYELTLLDWAKEHKGSSQYVTFANKCWPAFQTEFKFVPCYVNSRLAGRGIPVSCEVDIFGALSEYIGTCVSGGAVTLLDINNTVPPSYLKGKKLPYTLHDLFMGFHCGNTCSSLLSHPHMGYQLIMKRSLEPNGEPDITRGTIEGDLKPGAVTLYRLQGNARGQLVSYMAEGEVLDMPTESFGSIGVFAIPEMGRFYRHVLIEQHFPHHGAVAFGHYGKSLFSLFRMLGVKEIGYNRPKNVPYPNENP
ncbi:MAG: fucose isomerase, partial [Sphaerochaetaceae bacterium]